jgi:hypothetical protein
MVKKILVLFLLAAVSAAPLFAQTRQKTRIYVPTITGIGGGSDDAVFFSRIFALEVAAYGFIVAESRATADYTLSGNIYPNFTPEEGLVYYTLHAKLVNNHNNVTVVEQELLYDKAEETGEPLQVLIYNLLANIHFAGDAANDDWREKWVFFGFWGFWSPRIYRTSETVYHMANAGFGLSWEMNLLRFMSAEAAFDFSMDLSPETDDIARSISLEVPLMFKLVFKPGYYTLMEPYGGLQFNFDPQGGPIEISQFSWLAGLQIGSKVGPGVLFIEGRAIIDLDSIVRQGETADRIVVKAGMGYKWGAVQKK